MNNTDTNDFLTLSEIQEALKDKKLYVVADRTGLSYPTLKKLADGDTHNYTMATLQVVSRYITGTRESK